jgi:hypothetical protein
MESGYDIVVDNMNLNPNEWTSFKDIIKNFNDSQKEFVYTLEFRDFFIPVEECIARDALRPNPIGAKVIKETYRRYRQEMIDIDNQKLNDARLPYNPELPNCILADMDATLCFNTSGRPYFGAGPADKGSVGIADPPYLLLIRFRKSIVEHYLLSEILQFFESCGNEINGFDSYEFLKHDICLLI